MQILCVRLPLLAQLLVRSLPVGLDEHENRSDRNRYGKRRNEHKSQEGQDGS